MNFRKIRVELNLTQGEFANKLGVSRGAVASWEATINKKTPNDRNLFKIEKLAKGEL
jgi:DNA-binding transcriptional regulator YiaG